VNVVAAGTEDQEEEATMVREVAVTMDLVVAVAVAMEEVVSAIDVCLCLEIPSKISRQRLFN